MKTDILSHRPELHKPMFLEYLQQGMSRIKNIDKQLLLLEQVVWQH
jgi:hypothetical protein